jgi:hypothetical protein
MLEKFSIGKDIQLLINQCRFLRTDAFEKFNFGVKKTSQVDLFLGE